jgi:hypothetical protein
MVMSNIKAAGRLSGRHPAVADDLDTLLGEIGELECADLHTLQVGTAPARSAARRPAGAPAYYLGRPAEMWLNAFRRNWSRPERRAQSRDDGGESDGAASASNSRSGPSAP